MKHNNRLILWCDGIDSLLLGESKAAGIQVQMLMWARVFVEKGWSVYSFSTKDKPKDVQSIHFIKEHTPSWMRVLHLQLIGELYSCLKTMLSVKPRIIICRGSSRSLYYIALLSKWIGPKLVFFGASDLNFQIGKEAKRGAPINIHMYRKGLQKTYFFVTQNALQSETLKSNYNKSSIIIPNIWPDVPSLSSNKKKYDVIWVSNLKPLKRAEWVLNLADCNNDYQMAIIGGSANNDYYNSIEERAKSISNLYFGGSQPFEKTTELIGVSRVLLCTSTSEGFPNTFLQAWSQGIPVISTVDPSGIIEKYNLGIVVNSEEELSKAVIKMLEDCGFYKNCVESIFDYFHKNHSMEHAYNKLMSYLDEEQ